MNILRLCAASALAASLATPLQPDAANAQTSTPDFSGVYWTVRYNAKIELVGGGELPLTDAGKAAYAKNMAGLKDGSVIDEARKYCVPDGLPRIWANPYPLEILHGPPGQVMFLYELSHQIRTVQLDKPMPDEATLISFPYYNGHAVGHFDGDTLVVESGGFNEKTFIDATGAPHTSEMRVTERLRKVSPMQLEIVATIHDPDYYSRDWQARFLFNQRDDLRIEDYVCGEPHRDISAVPGVRRP